MSLDDARPRVKRAPRGQQSIEVRDERRHDFFMIDNEVLTVYGHEIGTNGIAVYAVLVMMSYGKGECYPSHTTIGKLVHLSRRTVGEAVAKLAEQGLIDIDEPDGKRPHASNLYRIKPVAKVRKNGTPSENASEVCENRTPVCNSRTEGAQELHTNKNLVNKNQEENGSIDPFQKHLERIKEMERLTAEAKRRRQNRGLH